MVNFFRREYRQVGKLNQATVVVVRNVLVVQDVPNVPYIPFVILPKMLVQAVELDKNASI